MSDWLKRLIIILALGVVGAMACFSVMVLWLDERAAERIGRWFTRLGESLINGVTDHLGMVIAAAVVAFVMLWSYVGFACLREWWRESTSHVKR